MRALMQGLQRTTLIVLSACSWTVSRFSLLLIIPFQYAAATTVEAIDLIHQRARIIITNLPKDTLASSVYSASQGLGNASPSAQEHGSLLNDLLAADHIEHDSATYLNELSTRVWNKIESSAQKKVNKIPSCIYFKRPLWQPVWTVCRAFKHCRASVMLLNSS